MAKKIHGFGFCSDCIAQNARILILEHPQGARVERIHGNLRHCLFYLLEGGATLRIPSSKKSNFIVLQKGDLFYAPPFLAYDSRYSEKSRILCVEFDLPVEEALFRRNMLTVLSHSVLADTPAEKNLLEGARDPLLFSAPQRLMWWIHELFVHLGEVDLIYGTPEKFRKLLPVIAELERDFSRDEKLEYYAAKAGLSPSGFRKLFGEYTGKSFVKFRNEKRFSHARDLILSGEVSVKEAAKSAGVENMGYFSRSYKKLFGKTPGAEKKTNP